MILRYSSAMREITSPGWQTLERLIILHKHSVPWESGLSDAKVMRHHHLATGTADEEINDGAEESATKLGLQEGIGLMEQTEEGAGGGLLGSLRLHTLINIIYNMNIHVSM